MSDVENHDFSAVAEAFHELGKRHQAMSPEDSKKELGAHLDGLSGYLQQRDFTAKGLGEIGDIVRDSYIRGQAIQSPSGRLSSEFDVGSHSAQLVESANLPVPDQTAPREHERFVARDGIASFMGRVREALYGFVDSITSIVKSPQVSGHMSGVAPGTTIDSLAAGSSDGRMGQSGISSRESERAGISSPQPGPAMRPTVSPNPTFGTPPGLAASGNQTVGTSQGVSGVRGPQVNSLTAGFPDLAR